MDRPAAALPAPAASLPETLRLRDKHLIGVVAAELALLALGIAVGRPVYAALLAAAVAYFLLAFRSPDIAWTLVWIGVPVSMERVVAGGTAVLIPTEPMMVLALGAWALRSIAKGNYRLPASPLHLPLATLAGIALISTFLGLRPVDGLKAWLVGATYASFGYLYFFVTPCTGARRERWMRLIAVLGASCGVYGALRVLHGGVALQNAYGLARPFFANHGSYGAYLAMILPLAFLLASERRGRSRILFGGATILIFLGILLSFSRATWLSLCVVLPLVSLLWLKWGRSSRPILALTGLTVVLIGFVVALGVTARFTRHVSTVVQTENVSNLERVNRWMAAIEMVRDRPWLGVGHGGYGDAYRSYRRKLVVTDRAFERMDAHSEVLRLLSEDGLLGLAAALWFLGTVGWMGFRVVRSAADRDTRLFALALLAGLGTYAVHGTIDSYLGLDKISVPFWAGIGAIAALYADSRGEPPAIARRNPRA